MIRKVRVKDLRPGNFIHDFNCDWNGSNIYIDQTYVKDSKIIDIIHSWGIKEVYIDTERGIDIAEDSPKKLARPPLPEKKAKPAAKASSHVNPAPPLVPLAEEIKTATKIRNDAAAIIEHTYQMLEQGKSPDIDLSYELTRKMRESITRNRDALLLLTKIRRKDEYTLYHSISVSSLVLDMCNFLGIEEKVALDLSVGALLHDIGKTKIPKRILNKPSRLDPEEFRVMKKHSEYSVDLLQRATNLPLECYDIALHHHEKFDGSGYPHNLKEQEISLGARLTAICDVFDAITSNRCYKEGVGTVTGLTEIYKLGGVHFDKDLANQFVRCIGVYPVGSCVRLEDGKVGVVVGTTEHLLKPIVKIFYDKAKKQKLRPTEVNLTKFKTGIEAYEESEPLGTVASKLVAEMVA